MSGDINSTTNFGIGSDVFHSIAQPGPSGAITPQVSASEEDNTDSDGDAASTSSSISLVTALASATLTDSWSISPSYSPQYLSTVSEYIPFPQKSPHEHATSATADDQENRAWVSEKYENSMRTDHVFDRFNERASHEPQQCVR